METYLLKSGACLIILYSFYKLFLERENMHVFKRYYLLGSLVLAFIIPLVVFTNYIPASTSSIPTVLSGDTVITWEEQKAFNYPIVILGSIYGLGVLFFTFLFGKNLRSMLFRIKKNPKVKNDNTTNVLLRDSVVPHTFFSYIFLQKQKFEANEIPEEVLLHEVAHAQQKHSIDVVLIELLRIVFWFNPILYFVMRSIKLNHEFLADQAVLKEGIPTPVYQNILLAFSSSAPSPQLANSINYSFIKKRFTVMKTQTSKKAIWLRSLLIIPLLSLLLFSFSNKKEVEIPNDKPNDIQINSLDLVQTSATRSEMKEYNSLAIKYNRSTEGNVMILKKEVVRIKFLYNKMSSKQREDAEPFPNFPPPPPKAQKVQKVQKAPKSVKVRKGDISSNNNIPPPPAPVEVIIGVNDMDENIPPPPPPPAPEEPIDHIVSMAKKGATFYYEGKKINSDRAIKLLKKNKSLNIQTISYSSKNPQVKISKKPIALN